MTGLWVAEWTGDTPQGEVLLCAPMAVLEGDMRGDKVSRPSSAIRGSILELRVWSCGLDAS